MNLLSYYKEKNTIKQWYEAYNSTKKARVIYAYESTNYRGLKSIGKVFKEFENVENTPRRDWPVYKENGQEKNKQHPVNMLATKLFYVYDNIYHKTEKGKRYNSFLDMDFSDNEKWIINYLFLLDSFILNRENYILNRSREIYNGYLSVFSKEEIDRIVLQFINLSNSDLNHESLFSSDYFFLHSFYDEFAFLKLYRAASKAEKEQLSEYIMSNHSNNTYACCLSKKYNHNCQYTIPMIKDDAKVFFISNLIYDINSNDFEAIVNEILFIYNKYFTINNTKVHQYLSDNGDVFSPIFANVFETDDSEEDEDYTDVPVAVSGDIDIPEERIDDTTAIGRKRAKDIFKSRKKIAREQTNYKCELHDLKGCRYFTSKTTCNDYVEVHHFIPKEFRNNFEYSLEVLANYITLCPHCHKMIHLATDRERIDAIRFIYNKRQARLVKVGLPIELNELLDYYKIETKS